MTCRIEPTSSLATARSRSRRTKRALVRRFSLLAVVVRAAWFAVVAAVAARSSTCSMLTCQRRLIRRLSARAVSRTSLPIGITARTTSGNFIQAPRRPLPVAACRQSRLLAVRLRLLQAVVEAGTSTSRTRTSLPSATASTAHLVAVRRGRARRQVAVPTGLVMTAARPRPTATTLVAAVVARAPQARRAAIR